MGSGHILVYAFDVLMQMYENDGYSQRDAAQCILENNLFGLDIDERAAQLAYFAVMMKARQYDRRFLTRGIQPNLYHPGTYAEGQEFGSLLIVDELEPKPEQPDELTLFDGNYGDKLNTWNFRSLLAKQYDVVVTNPPYMGSSNMNDKLSKFVKDNHPDAKGDLFACFIERVFKFAKSTGYVSMITMESWMFLSSFEKCDRESFLEEQLSTWCICRILERGVPALELTLVRQRLCSKQPISITTLRNLTMFVITKQTKMGFHFNFQP